jgi:hypothetical protein
MPSLRNCSPRRRDSVVADFLTVASPPRASDDDRVYSGHQETTYEIRLDGDAAVLYGRFFEMTAGARAFS